MAKGDHARDERESPGADAERRLSGPVRNRTGAIKNADSGGECHAGAMPAESVENGKGKPGRPKGSRTRPHSMLAAELVAKQLFKVLKDDPGYVERLDDRDRIKLITQVGPILRRLADDWTPANDDRTYTIEFAGPAVRRDPIPDDQPLPPLEGAADAEADETREEPSGVTVDALRAVVAEQDALAAEDAAEAAREAKLEARYQDGWPAEDDRCR